MEQKPSVGRVVHYVAYGTPGGEFPAGVCRAAIITETYLYKAMEGKELPPGALVEFGLDDVASEVGLCVLNPTGQFFNRNVPHDENQKAPGSWHWPERV